MDSAKYSSIRILLNHTFIVLILAMIPSFVFLQITASQVTLSAISPFWQHSSDSIGAGLSFTLYPIILLLVFAISIPSYFLLFLRRRIPKSTSILKYTVIMAAFTILISYSIVPLSQFVLTVMPYVSHREWFSLEWFGSLVLVFLIVIPSIRWELNRYLAREEKPPPIGLEASSVWNPCNPERVGQLMFYVAILAPFAFQSYSRNPVFLDSMFYSVSTSGLSVGELSISFMGFPSIIMPLILPVLALRLLFVYKTVAYILGKEQDHIIVIIGLLSLILDTISMPLTMLEVPFTVGPFPLLFTAGLLTMYKCYVRKCNYSPSSGKMNMTIKRTGSRVHQY